MVTNDLRKREATMKKLNEKIQKGLLQKSLNIEKPEVKIQKHEKSKTLEKDLPAQSWKECKTWTFLP